MSSETKRTAVQEALLKLRRDLGYTQAQVASLLNVSVVTVSRWEGPRPPSGISLVQLANFARVFGHREEAVIFETALEPLVPRDSAHTPLKEEPAKSAIVIAREVAKQDAGVAREYVAAVRALERALALIGKHPHKLHEDRVWLVCGVPVPHFVATHEGLIKEVQDEEERQKQSKKKR